MKKTLAQRFWEKVDKDGPVMPGMETACWIWTGCAPEVSSGFRYGQIRAGGKTCYSHRVGYQLQHGADPGKSDVDHICHNTLCVRGTHLRLATRSQNNQNRSGVRRDNKSGVHGVSWNDNLRKWEVHVCRDGQDRYFGVFKTLEQAEAVAVATRCELFSHNDIDRSPDLVGCAVNA